MNHAINNLNNLNKEAISSESLDNPVSIASEYGYKKANKGLLQSFGLSIFAGIFISIAFAMHIVQVTIQQAVWFVGPWYKYPHHRHWDCLH